jgi:hypothetical protein
VSYSSLTSDGRPADVEQRLLKGHAMNLPHHLKELLGELVSLYEAKGSAAFYLNELGDGWYITYPSGPFFKVRYDHLDELRRKQLIRLVRKHNCDRGWPASGGSVRSGASPPPRT